MRATARTKIFDYKMLKQHDFLVVGSGFGGSITAMALAKLGYKVCVVERGEHPRFAIGESSTPIADMILRDLADNYDLPFLKEISRYGEWQKHHPEIMCGLKRGFSYYPHQKGEQFTTCQNHSRELLVAASRDDENSDTNWLRSDVDHFLVQQLAENGVEYLDHTTIKEVKKTERSWLVNGLQNRSQINLSAAWIIDATGSPDFSEMFLGTSSLCDGFYTNSFAVFSHFNDAKHWLDYLIQHEFKTEDYPYNPDHSALHHLVDEGWFWMLRFNNNLLSSGLVIDSDTHHELNNKSADHIWSSVMSSYPSLKKLFNESEPAKTPGKLIKTKRLQRRLDNIFGDGWIALNHTAGFVDPMHSTGIAHTLAGIEKVLNVFGSNGTDHEKRDRLQSIQSTVFKELELIDLLVSSCYKARGNFRLFSASVMLYFAASIKYEQARLNGSVPDSFLCASDQQLFDMIVITHSEIAKVQEAGFSERDVDLLAERIRERIAPFNSAGLMDDSRKNMYEHTAVTL